MIMGGLGELGLWRKEREKRAVYQPTLFQETCEMDLMEKAWIWETIGTNPAAACV